MGLAAVSLIAQACSGPDTTPRDLERSVPPSPTEQRPLNSPEVEPTEPPAFSGTSSTVDRSRLPHSWREGCPVEVAELRLLTVSHWGFDGSVHSGELVVHEDHASDVLAVMKQIFEARFPIEKMQLVDAYGGDDDRSMEANNSSGFNCRAVEGRPGAWSQHAYGRAIDINPVQNPYVSADGEVQPPAGRSYADRSQRSAGMIHPADAVVAAFESIGWKWGGYWGSTKDYQHFSSNGR